MFSLGLLQDTVSTNKINLSWGELTSMYSDKELIIHPDHRSAFDWSNTKKTRLVESILINLPVPGLILIKNPNQILELIDGMQRLCTVIQFIDPKALDTSPLILEKPKLTPELNGKSFQDLPLSLKIEFKRRAVEAMILSVNYKKTAGNKSPSIATDTMQDILTKTIIEHLSYT